MPRLNVNQKTVQQLFSEKDSDFLIPDYQRPYAWTEEECRILWDDFFSFAFPDDDYTQFDSSDEYFLGSIVVFRNHNDKLEVIDGQQRIITLMLLLRAFYEAYGSEMKDENSLNTKHNIEKCLWKTDEFDKPDMSSLKIESEVVTDNDREELKEILLTGEAPKKLKSRYAVNYRFFQTRIRSLIKNTPACFPYMSTRIIKNCILLPIEAESQDTAFRIFSTLNDRGKPLSDSDIFKSQLYKAFLNDGSKDEFMSQWKQLENICEKIFKSGSVDEIFTRYMYFERAKQGNTSTTVEGLRKFYEADNYKLLRENHKQTFENLIALANFWNDIANQDQTRFSKHILKKLFVLNYAPNAMWTNIVSVYFMQNKDRNNKLNEKKFFEFLNITTLFILASSILKTGVDNLKSPMFHEMVNIVNKKSVTFTDFRFNPEELETALRNYSFLNKKPVTRFILAWYAFAFKNQELIPIETKFDIEHIYAQNRQPPIDNVESIGNKSLLEKRINIHATDYGFEVKAGYYLGDEDEPGTQIYELAEKARTMQDFNARHISIRQKKIIKHFMTCIQNNNLAR